MKAQLLSSTPTEDLRLDYARARAVDFDEFLTRRDPSTLTRNLRRLTDKTLIELWQIHRVPSSFALLAVGGFGRGELFPHSDVDLLILVDATPIGEAVAALESFVSACWDVGMAIGHSVRTPLDCLEHQTDDGTIQTALLERRFITGDQLLAADLTQQLARSLGAEEYFATKMLEMQQRHAKYEDTPYSLEPNTKESPGGLRDLHTIAWVAEVAGFGKNWQTLFDRGLLTHAELQMIRYNGRLLARIRTALHIVADRREDRLVYDLQGSVAALLGYKDRPGRRASEQLMQRYYRAAKTITQLSTLILQNIEEAMGGHRDWPAEPIDHEFCSKNHLLEPINEHLFRQDSSAILRAFLCLQKTPGLRGMSTSCLRAIWNARTLIDGAFRRQPANRAVFLQIMRSPKGVTRALRIMNQWSILGHYLPVFRRIVGRLQHDLFHVYTVDQHIMTVLRNLRRFAISDHLHEYPFCSQLMADVDDQSLLYIAALYHDIAKGRGGDHSTLGAIDARKFCRQHGLSESDTSLVCFLVENHLTMSTVAQKQDISDPTVLQNFANTVGTEERLAALYLLTVADIRGTSPKVWNGWKAKLLEDLFRATKRVLDGENPAREERYDARRREAFRILERSDIQRDQYRDLWDNLETAYFLRTDAADIAWHASVLGEHSKTNQAIVRSRRSPFGEGFQVVMYLEDQVDLFARICGFFDSASLSVLDAQIHTTDRGYALDNFLVVDPYQKTPSAEKLAALERALAERLSLRHPLEPAIEGRTSRRSRYFPIKPKVELRPDESGRHYLLSIVANDRTGLSYRIALVLAKHGITVYAARIATLGERGEDTFRIDGDALANPKHQIQLENELLAALAVKRK